MEITEFTLSKETCEHFTEFVYQEKHKWAKDLNNVKSLTSGFNPDYAFLHNLGYFVCENILPKITNYKFWRKTCWWVNFYEEGHFTNPHIHEPEEYSMIVIIKPAKGDKYYLTFITENTSYKVKETEGLCLLFKSNLVHSVDPVDSDRITIAMDFCRYNI